VWSSKRPTKLISRSVSFRKYVLTLISDSLIDKMRDDEGKIISRSHPFLHNTMVN
jgi:hypothetical protein